MLPIFEFCLPTKSDAVPTGPDSLHEVKNDGYRLRLERDGDRVRLITPWGLQLGRPLSVDRRGGLEEPVQAVRDRRRGGVLGVNGVADFNALHSRKHDDEVQLYAFDIMTLDGEDLRGLPLSLRKTNLARLLDRRPDGIFVAPFEQGEIGPELFRAACNMGSEGLVSKRRESQYRPGRSPDWIKVQEPDASRDEWGARRSSMMNGQEFSGKETPTLSPKTSNWLLTSFRLAASKRACVLISLNCLRVSSRK